MPRWEGSLGASDSGAAYVVPKKTVSASRMKEMSEVGSRSLGLR
jgi:hypothetical protein